MRLFIIKRVCIFKCELYEDGHLFRRVIDYAAAPARHRNLILRLPEDLKRELQNTNLIELGFLGDRINDILDRKEAKIMAIATGQYKPFTKEHMESPYCYSEDLW